MQIVWSKLFCFHCLCTRLVRGRLVQSNVIICIGVDNCYHSSSANPSSPSPALECIQLRSLLLDADKRRKEAQSLTQHDVYYPLGYLHSKYHERIYNGREGDKCWWLLFSNPVQFSRASRTARAVKVWSCVTNISVDISLLSLSMTFLVIDQKCVS